MKLNVLAFRACVVGSLVLAAVSSCADEPKNHDFDVVRDEAQVPPYQLPLILVSAEGKPITTPEEWFNVRRPQIMALFGNLIYGVVPAPETPIKTTFEVVKANREFMNERAIRKDVCVWFEKANGSTEMMVLRTG